MWGDTDFNKNFPQKNYRSYANVIMFTFIIQYTSLSKNDTFATFVGYLRGRKFNTIPTYIF